MKYLMLVLLCLFLQGCMYQTIDKSDLIAAEAKCKEVGSEIFEIKALFWGDETVICLNRKSYVL